MTVRRPIVSVQGRRRQLPAGDVVAGMPVYLPAYQAGGAVLRLALNLDYTLPVQLATGGSLSVQVVING